MPYKQQIYKVRDALTLSLPLFYVSFVALLLKFHSMTQTGYRTAERALSRVYTHTAGDSFSFLDKMSFYADDIFIGVVVIPFCLYFIHTIFTKRTLLAFVATLSFALLGVLLIQIQAENTLGTPTSYTLFLDSIHFMFDSPQVALSYLSWSYIIKSSLLMVGLIGVCFFTWYLLFKENSFLIASSLALCISFLGLFSIVSLSGSSIPKNTQFHQNYLIKNVKYFMTISKKPVFKMENPNSKKLKAHFEQQIAHQKPFNSIVKNNNKTKVNYFGAQKESDVIVFIMETAPSKVLPLSPDNTNTPAINTLLPHALYSNNHHTTFPYSNLAIFSLLTSWYPMGKTDNLVLASKKPLPSFVHPLIERGYQQKLYIPCEHLFKFDEVTYQKAGLTSFFKACNAIDKATIPDDHIKAKIQRDHVAFTQLLDDVDQYNARNQRYVSVFAPQIGHAPWLDIEQTRKDVVSLGKEAIHLQDQWIGELIARLKRNGSLEHTVIVITGDHGIRTRKEDPQFLGNIIDNYSYNVPLVIYAPKAFKKATPMTINSTHLDIKPTLLNLLGIKDNPLVTQGMDLLNPVQRDLYFLGHYYMGADGYSSKNHYYSYNFVTDETYLYPKTLDFTNASPINEQQQQTMVKKRIADFYAFQFFWLNYFLFDH